MKKLIFMLFIALCCSSNISAMVPVTSTDIDSIVIKVHGMNLDYPTTKPRMWFDGRYKNKYAQYSGYRMINNKREIFSFIRQINLLTPLSPHETGRSNEISDVNDPLDVVTGKVEIYYKNRIEILWCSNFEIEINNSRYDLSEELKKIFRSTPSYYKKPIPDKNAILDTVSNQWLLEP